MNTVITIAQAAEEYLRWSKAHRTEKFWKRQERILKTDVIPAIGNLTIAELVGSGDLFRNLQDNIESVKAGSDAPRAMAAVNLAATVCYWYSKR